jgi:hypothetical protein
MRQLYAVMDAYRDETGYGVRIEQDSQLQTTAKVELAWVYGRQEHVIKYTKAEPALLPSMLAHEFEHITLAAEARAAGRNKHFASGPSHRRTAQRAIDKDVERIQRRRRTDPNAYRQFIDQIVSGLTSQLYNAPLDLVIDYRVHTKYPFLHDSQFVWMSEEQQRNLRAVTDTTIREMTPTKILQANVAMNAAMAVFVDAIFNGATTFVEQYRSSGQLATGQRLYALWKNMLPRFSAGDEFDLVDAFAKELKLSDWYMWQADEEQSVEGERATSSTSSQPAASGLAAFLEEPAAQMAVTMYIVGALKRFSKLSRQEVVQIAGEIGLLGQTGIDFTSSDQKYTLRFLPGEQFSGLQLLALMYTGFKQVEPTLDTGIPLDAAYQQARRLFELGM